MIQGLYAAASGMIALEARQDAIANNIANVSTTGFKRQEPVQLGFYQVLSDTLKQPSHFKREAAPGGGVKLVETYPNLASGVLQPTDNPMHMALQGPGYFVVNTEQGERFTRAGDFGIDAEGHLATQNGHKVERVGGGPIDVRGGRVIIDETGNVTVNGVPAGQLQVVEFESPTRLERAGDNLYLANEEVGEGRRAAEETLVKHQHLEMSNVNLPKELSSMLLGMRAYEANQRVIQTLDDSVSRLIDQVGFPR